jgi:hypothetical protein
MKPLSDQQLKTVQTAAAPLPPAARDSFLRSIAGRLVDIATPSDADIAAAVNFVLSTRGISTPAYLCDGATLTNRRQSRRKIFSQRYPDQYRNASTNKRSNP